MLNREGFVYEPPKVSLPQNALCPYTLNHVSSKRLLKRALALMVGLHEAMVRNARLEPFLYGHVFEAGPPSPDSE